MTTCFFKLSKKIKLRFLGILVSVFSTAAFASIETPIDLPEQSPENYSASGFTGEVPWPWSVVEINETVFGCWVTEGLDEEVFFKFKKISESASGAYTVRIERSVGEIGASRPLVSYGRGDKHRQEVKVLLVGMFGHREAMMTSIQAYQRDENKGEDGVVLGMALNSMADPSVYKYVVLVPTSCQ